MLVVLVVLVKAYHNYIYRLGVARIWLILLQSRPAIVGRKGRVIAQPPFPELVDDLYEGCSRPYGQLGPRYFPGILSHSTAAVCQMACSHARPFIRACFQRVVTRTAKVAFIRGEAKIISNDPNRAKLLTDDPFAQDTMGP